VGVKVSGNADGVFENDSFDIVASIDIDTAHELRELARSGLVMAAGLIDGFTNKVQRHGLTFSYFRYGKVSMGEV
jgi:hypothetical protein